MSEERVIVSKRHALTVGFVTKAIWRHTWRRCWWFIVIAWLVGAVGVSLGICLGDHVLPMLGLFLLIYPAVFPMMAWRSAVKGKRLFSTERTMRISGDGLDSEDALGNQGSVKWPTFEFARRAPGLWMLYLPTGVFVMVPDFAIEAEDQPALDALFRSKMRVK